MHDHQNCRDLFAQLSEYLDNELDEVTCEAIEQHIQHCPPCQVCLSTLQRTVALCRQMAQPVVPQELAQRLRTMIARQSV
jgi:anti-sigma factor RsiW